MAFIKLYTRIYIIGLDATILEPFKFKSETHNPITIEVK